LKFSQNYALSLAPSLTPNSKILVPPMDSSHMSWTCNCCWTSSMPSIEFYREQFSLELPFYHLATRVLIH